MIEQLRRSTALLAVAMLFPAVSHAKFEASVDGTVKPRASELFGAGRDVAIEDVKIVLTNKNTINSRNEGKITFALNGAVFNAPANVSKVTVNPAVGDERDVLISVVSGGGDGDRDVVYRFEVDSDGQIAVDDKIIFEVPNLTVAARAKEVWFSVKIEALRSTGGDGGFPNQKIEATTVPTITPPDTIVFKTANALKFSAASGQTPAAVAVEESARGRTTFVPTTGTTVGEGDETEQALLIGTVMVDVNSGIYDADGKEIAADNLSGLSGDVELAVSGRLRNGDRVFVNDGAGRSAKRLEDLALATADDAITATGDFALKEGNYPVYYVPNGKDNLRPTTISFKASIDFESSDAVSPKPVNASNRIIYQGLQEHGYAYGVVRGEGREQSFLRITCDQSGAAGGDCDVFLDCYDQDGNSYFSTSVEISENHTKVMDSDEIAEVLGGGWKKGRGACKLLSDGQLVAQHLVRAGDILMNNTNVARRVSAQLEISGTVATSTGEIMKGTVASGSFVD